MGDTLHIALLAGESSGDILGAGLMQALRAKHPDIRFSGIGGPLMEAEGLQSQVPMERLSVMGLVEPLKRLPELLRIRRRLVRTLLADPPAVFIGIDSPDFNLRVELRLRARGIKTVHYVSPSVWAWRRRRIELIARAVDLVLTLFPFEAEFYRDHQVPVKEVGHPLADLIPLKLGQVAARQRLSLPTKGPVLAVLPGSRQGEVARLGPDFIATIRALQAADPALQVLIPAANAERRAQLEALLGTDTDNIQLLDGQAREAMTAADAVLLASGTAALEAMLLKRPMLVCYRLAPLSYFLISRMLKVPYFSLPNLLLGEQVVEELVQDEVSVAALVPRLQRLLAGTPEWPAILSRYEQVHEQLRGDASERAARAVLELV